MIKGPVPPSPDAGTGGTGRLAELSSCYADEAMADVERRFWPGHPEDTYTFSEWYAFVQSINPTMSTLEAHKETEGLWGMAATRLIDQECVNYNSILEGARRLDTIVVMASCSRMYVDALNPAMRRDGCLVTFGRPGDSMSGFPVHSLLVPGAA